MKDTFNQLYENHHGKISDKWSLYLDKWNDLLSEYRNRSIQLLEIGIQNGGSLEIWSKYFAKAKKIIGCDIDEKCVNLTYDDPRIALIVGDANTDEVEKQILSEASILDVIIDDGSHTSTDIVRSFARYFPYLTDGGIYVAEDLHCSYWEEFEGGLHTPYSSIAFFKRLADIVNFEHWRNNKPRKHLLKEFAEKFNVDFAELDLARIHSIEFINSICVIRKLSPEKNSIGKRIIVGTEEAITTEWQKLKSTSIHDIAMKISEEGSDIFELIDQVDKLKGIIGAKQAEISDLNEQIKQLNEQIKQLNDSFREQNEQFNFFNESLNESLRERDSQINLLNQLVKEQNKQIINLDRETVNRGKWGLKLDAELQTERERLAETTRLLYEATKSLDDAINSNSWKVTLPLRETKLWISEPGHQTKRYTKKLLRTVKRLYQALPIDIETIEGHRTVLAKYAPLLLLGTDTRLDGNEISPIEISSEEFNIPELPQENDFFADVIDPIDRAQTIDIQTSENPLVSVIIPVYGQIDYTLSCLASIAATPPQVPFEIIVVDDCSPDNSAEVLSKVKSIRLLKNEQNQGFIKSCNAGAGKAIGKYVYFLNNDTQVTEGWMDELVRTFSEFPETGLAGSKLIYPDGRLQEAGGIIWQDGSAWNYGRLQDPRMPVYNYAREVDYCSGASTMLLKSLFEELGGFDNHYSPAYCEDSDLALKVRDKGYRVIYQPLSTIIHYEGITSGTDLTGGAKAYQVENSKKLFSRWKNHLASHQAHGFDVDNAKDRRAKHRILVLENCTPTPNQDAGSVTVFNLLLLLREMDFQVTFIPVDNFLYVPEYTTALQRIGVEMLYAPFVITLEQHLQEYGERYDLAFLFRPDLVEKNIEVIRQYCTKAKLLYYTHDLHFLRMSREAELFQDGEKFALAEEMKAREFEAINASDIAILVSEQEREVIQDDFPEDKLHVLPLILNTPGTEKAFSERQDIVFVGGFQHTPNIDAVQYFVSEIMPILRTKLPGVSFYVVGSKPPDEIKALASEDVIIAGFIEELNPLLDKMRISVAPLRYGAGIKGKIGTAMAVGIPVVATNIAAEGMLLNNGDNILVANDPESFAESIAELYQDEELWNKLSEKGLEFASKAWGAEQAWSKLAGIITILGIDISDNKYPLSLYSEFDAAKLTRIKQ